MIEWNLRSRSHTCHQCAEAFADRERCFSAVGDFTAPIVQELLAEKIAAQADDAKAVKNPDYVRLDFCAACWDAVRASDWISAWHSPYTAPEPPTPEPLPRETAESLLHKLLEDENSGENTSVIFILAVMLERKKVLIERNVRRSKDGTIVRVYEHKKTGEVMLITDPDLQLDEIPGVQQLVKNLLEAPTSPQPETPFSQENMESAETDPLSADVPEVAGQPPEAESK